LSFFKPVLSGEPVSVGHVDLCLHLRVLLSEHKSFIPFLALYMKTH
jgi:hypothetical protein